MKREFRFKKIDAFTGMNSSGNPAAAVYLEGRDRITEREMQQIASELKGFVCEVAYVVPEENAKLRFRYFSSEREVQFCGHATVAVMYDYFSRAEGMQDGASMEVMTNKGIIRIENRLKSENSVYVEAPPPVFNPCGIGGTEISKALGIDPGLIDSEYPLSIVNAGNQTLCVPIIDASGVVGMKPDYSELREFCLKHSLDVVNVFSRDVFGKSNAYRTRVFAPTFGYLEDPATGSGNAALGYALRENGFWDGAPIALEQGESNDNPNIVRMLMKKDSTGQERVFFGGKATVRIDGVYDVYGSEPDN